MNVLTKCIKSCVFIVVAFHLTAALAQTSSPRQHIITGTVEYNNQRLSSAKVELLISNRSVSTAYTNTGGDFRISIDKLSAFSIRVSLAGYDTYTSSLVQVSATQASYDQGTIQLNKTTTASLPSTRATIMPVKDFVTQRLTALHFMPTNGAYNLFYALNPGLENKTEVSSDYRIRYPELPKFNAVRKLFKRRYKKDRKRDGPYIYANRFTQKMNDEPATSNLFILASYHQPHVPADSLLDNYFGEKKIPPPPGTGKVKKFVFVFYTLDGNGKPIFLENRYKVYYYTENEKGDESLYNKTANATYGYAPMSAKIYDVEVYDQQQNDKRVQVSDDQVDPYDYFLKNDLYNSWIKIAIQVYE